MKDEQLEAELEQWKLDIPRDPGFERAVLRKIAKQEQFSPARRLATLLDELVRPKLAVPLGVSALVITTGLAAFHGNQDRAAAWSELALSYGRAIDPIAQVQSTGEQR